MPTGFDGPGPNPLLQNHPLMVIHPPMLYLGYVGFTVPFAFAIAALVTGRLGEGWLVATRRWTLDRLGLPHRRHHPRRLVELRGPRLGRLLGLGPGRERQLPALAHRHRLPPLGDGAGAAGDAAGLEPVAGVRHVLAHDPRHVPHPLRRPRLRARLQRLARSAPMLLGVLRPRRDRDVRAHRLARRRRSARRVGSTPPSAARAASSSTTCSSPPSRSWCCSAPCSRSSWRRRPATSSPSASPSSTPWPCRSASPCSSSWPSPRCCRGARPRTRPSPPRLTVPAWIGAAALVIAVLLGARGFVPLLAFGLGGFAAGAAGRQVVLATRRQGWRGLVGRANGGMVVHLGVVLIAVALGGVAELLHRAAPHPRGGRIGDRRRAHRRARRHLHRGHRPGHGVEGPGPDRRRADLRAGDLAVHQRQPEHRHPVGAAPASARTSTSPSCPAPTSRPEWSVLRVIVQPLIVWLWIGGVMMFVGTFLAAFPGRRRRDPLDPVSAPVTEERTAIDRELETAR